MPRWQSEFVWKREVFEEFFCYYDNYKVMYEYDFNIIPKRKFVIAKGFVSDLDRKNEKNNSVIFKCLILITLVCFFCGKYTPQKKTNLKKKKIWG